MGKDKSEKGPGKEKENSKGDKGPGKGKGGLNKGKDKGNKGPGKGKENSKGDKGPGKGTDKGNKTCSKSGYDDEVDESDSSDNVTVAPSSDGI